LKTLRKHILVVDDDPALRTLFQALLENYGYTSETAGNGGEAETKLARGHYDTVLLDYMMPGPNGMTVLHRIQQHYPSLPVVMITGESRSQVASQALAAGARACLYKPFDCKDFEEVLRSTVGIAPLRAGMSGHVAPTS
jgi:CheY-like chemotaxis protein